MKVGSKGRYAVIAVVDVARNSATGAVPLADVASRQKISLSYLEQLFAMLRRSGVVISARGPGGGYRLSRPAENMTIREIFEAVDETGAQNGADEGPGDADIAGATSQLWAGLHAHIRAFLDDVSVADVLSGRAPYSQTGGDLSPSPNMS